MYTICIFDPLSIGLELAELLPRVSEVIAKMRYTALVRRQIIPDLEAIQPPWSRYRYPDYVGNRYSDFGSYCEHKLKHKLSSKFECDWGNEPELSDLFPDNEDMRIFLDKCLTVANSWIPEYGQKLRFNVELTAKNFTGHPDIITEKVIWDVKCGYTNKTARQGAYLQILAYWAMSDVDYIGLILPLTNKYVIFDMRGWNRKPFLHELNQVAKCIRISKSCCIDDLLGSYPIGRAVSNNHMLEPITNWIQECIEKHNQVRPMQMYLENPRGRAKPSRRAAEGPLALQGSAEGRSARLPAYGEDIRENTDSLSHLPGQGQSAKTVDNLPAARELIVSYGLQYFTHAPLSINLANKSLNYMTAKLRRGLEQTVFLQGKGFVVHVGKSNACSIEQSYINQANVIKSILPSATPGCRVLLETPCGKSSDICVRIGDMHDFLYNNFTESERNLIGLCVDTCHVFVAGYDPLEYLEEWLENGCVGIGLVHFNDSENFYGRCVEGHKYPGSGAIGYKKMRKVADFCVNHGIPMIFE